MNEQGKQLLDITAVSTMLAAMAAWLPPFAALFTIIWTGIRIYESATFQKFLTRLQRPE
jgi:hypothetical protein